MLGLKVFFLFSLDILKKDIPFFKLDETSPKSSFWQENFLLKQKINKVFFFTLVFMIHIVVIIFIQNMAHFAKNLGPVNLERVIYQIGSPFITKLKISKFLFTFLIPMFLEKNSQLNTRLLVD